MSQYLQILLISAVLVVLGTAKPASSEFDDEKIQALRRLLLVDLRALDGDLMPDMPMRPLNVESGERLQKRRLVMGMPNILHMGSKRMV
uniref:Uncharacterized protein n=3 Tax=Bursaphelenchus xylophilus TaxID=6326 RepID=A0A1I7SPM6_BURXY